MCLGYEVKAMYSDSPFQIPNKSITASGVAKHWLCFRHFTEKVKKRTMRWTLYCLFLIILSFIKIVFIFLAVYSRLSCKNSQAISQAPTSKNTIALRDNIFDFHGFPDTVVSDNMSIFTSDEFRLYCKGAGVI